MPAPPPDVTVIGAGIAGMTAALKLLESGLTVRVLEASSGVGGKFGARYANGGYHDFAWHVLAEWCENFWDVARTIGVDKERDFSPCPRLTLLRPRGSPEPRGATIQDVSSPDYFWSNASSGVAHWSDIVLFAYSLFTLECDASINDERRGLRKEFLNRIPVNAYMRSLPHMSDIAALLHNELLLRIWG